MVRVCADGKERVGAGGRRWRKVEAQSKVGIERERKWRGVAGGEGKEYGLGSGRIKRVEA